MKDTVPITLPLILVGFGLSGCSDIQQPTVSQPTGFEAAVRGRKTPAGPILISDTHGVLWSFDMETGTVHEYYRFDGGGNFDIKYSSPSEMVIANLGGRIDQLNLVTKEWTTFSADPRLGAPIGIAVSPRGFFYITDHGECGGQPAPAPGKVLSLNVRTGVLEVLADRGPDGGFVCPDGIVEDPRGRVLFTDQSGRIYRISPKTKLIQIVGRIPGRHLNGIALMPNGDIIVASHGPTPGGVFKVDPKTGAFQPLWEGPPLRNPEDVAVDHRGNIYIQDSDFMHEFPNFLPGLYVLNRGSETLRMLASGYPFGDVVDLLLTPFTGFH